MASTSNTVRVGEVVKVGPRDLYGRPHPHAGRYGKITEFFTLREPVTAQLCLVDEPNQGHFIIVSLQCLEKIEGR